MKILINDLAYWSDMPDELKSPSLQEKYPNTGPLLISFNIPADFSAFEIISGVLAQPLFMGISGILSQPLFGGISGTLAQPMSVLGANTFDCIGIGGTDATQVIINGSIQINSPDGRALKDGLYEIGEELTTDFLSISHNGTYMGRIALGPCREICISPSREPGFSTNIKERESLSGATLDTAGGFGREVIGVEWKYKVTREIYTDYQRAYITQIMKGYPFFIDFNNDDWLPIDKFYGKAKNKLVFQSSVNRFLYSKRETFRQAF